MNTQLVNFFESHLTNPENGLSARRLQRSSPLHLDGAGPPSAREQPTPKVLLALTLAAMLGGAASLANAATIDINPSKDNTLYEYVAADGDRSNALGLHFFTGETAMGELRRGVLAFDIAGNVPAGSTIKSVTLTLNMSRTPSSTPRTVELHRLLA